MTDSRKVRTRAKALKKPATNRGVLIGPLFVFLSYATEDDEIVRAISTSLDELGKSACDNIRPVKDTKYFVTGEHLWKDIEDNMIKSDYFFYDIFWNFKIKPRIHWG